MTEKALQKRDLGSGISWALVGVLALVAAVVVLIGAGVLGGSSETGGADAEPAVVEPVPGTELSRVTLTARAHSRLGVQTTKVRRQRGRSSVPYSAIIYAPDGGTWVYTSPQPLVFVRARVEVDRIERDTARLRKGPDAGTTVVTVAAAELYGAEFGVGH